MTLAQALLLGIIQGLTEFLPVSSSGHLAIAQSLLPGFEQPGLLFDVLLHCGTLLAVVVYFRADLLRLARAPLAQGEEGAESRRLLLLLVGASIPTAVIGLLLKDLAERFFEEIPFVALMLLVTGVLLFVAERLPRGRRGERDLGLADALLAGTAQGLAVLPGLSRSGSTIAALLCKDIDGETAARFSFLISLPAILGAALLSLADLKGVPAGAGAAYLAGAAAAFAVGLGAIHCLLAVIRRRRLFVFALYCWMAGGILLLVG